MKKEYIIIHYYNTINNNLSFIMLRNCENNANGLKSIITHCTEYFQTTLQDEKYFIFILSLINIEEAMRFLTCFLKT